MPKTADASRRTAASRRAVMDQQSLMLLSAGEFFWRELNPVKAAEHCDAHLFAGKEILRDCANLLGCHSFDARHHLIHAEEPSEEELLPGDVRHARRGRFQTESEGAFQVVF